MATVPAALSTTKAAAPPGGSLRRTVAPVAPRPGAAPAERLLEAQRRRMIVIVVAPLGEQPIAGFFIACDRPRVVLVHFQPDGSAAPPPRRPFRRGEKERPQAAPAESVIDGYGIDAGQSGSWRI